MKITSYLGVSFAVSGCLFAQGASLQFERRSNVLYMDQPTGIETSVYASTWSLLRPLLNRLTVEGGAKLEADLRLRSVRSDVSDGELNLLAQLQWQHGELAEADATVERAVAMQPHQSLNAFQSAMVCFAHLRRATGKLEQWRWQQRTRDAYQRTLTLDTLNTSARYYLAYSYMNTPGIGGGDKGKALEIAQQGIEQGQVGFYAVRADAHRLRGEIDAANSDYDTTIRMRVIKLGGLLDAASEEMGNRRWDRAKRYLDWAVYCRPDAAKVHEELGDYYVGIADQVSALRSYETALQRDSNDNSARRKLAVLMRQR